MIFDFIMSGFADPFGSRRHRLAGIVTDDGAPASRLICVFGRASKVLLTAKWSNSTTGAWEIKGLPEYPERSLFVLGFDSTGQHNAEIADYVSQVTS